MNGYLKRTKHEDRRGSPRARRTGAVLIAALLSPGVLGIATAQATREEPADDGAERGETLYRIHCMSCHGKEGAGDGPVAVELVTRPTDLRLLAHRAGGEFPAEEVRAAIDGRTEVTSHGTREMPVWGLSFAERGLDVPREREIQAELDALVRYLAGIQRR